MSAATKLIVGDGRVGRALASAFAHSGLSVLQWSRRQGGAVPVADEILLAVKDDAIAQVGAQVVAAQPALPVVLHCAGALPSGDVLGAIPATGRALLHPLRALTGGETSLAGTVFGIEGDAAGVAVARSWAHALGGEPLRLDAAQLGRYHAAAALVANHSVGLVDAARALLVDAGLADGVAVRALGQLLSSSAGNIVHSGLPAALTGPIARGDVAVVARHLAELAGRPEAALYRQTARRVVPVARALGQARSADLDAIESLLDLR